MWINGKEVFKDEDYTPWAIENTIFCRYKETCGGLCNHNLGFGLGESIDSDHPLYKEKIAQFEGVEG